MARQGQGKGRAGQVRARQDRTGQDRGQADRHADNQASKWAGKVGRVDKRARLTELVRGYFLFPRRFGAR